MKYIKKSIEDNTLPEKLILDLIASIDSLGMERVIKVLTEVVEILDSKNLWIEAIRYPNSIAIRRLGFLLEYEFENEKLSQVLYESIANRKENDVLLISSTNKRGIFNSKWRIIMNYNFKTN